MKKVLITGGAGFIGSTLSGYLVEKQNRVTVIDNFNTLYDPALKRRNLLNLEKSGVFQLHEADITDKARLDEIFMKEKPDVVIHIAGLTGMEASMVNPLDFFNNNVAGTANVLECARLNETGQVIYISTSTVYGDRLAAAREEDVLPEPVNFYAASKLMAEQLCSRYAGISSAKIILLRLCTVYGPRQRPNMAIARFVSKIIMGEKVSIYGNGLATRDYLYIDDCVKAIWLAMHHPDKSGIFNISGQEGVNINEIVETISALLDKPVQVVHEDCPAVIPLNSGLNISKARNILGFNPESSIKEGIQRYINWYLEPY